MKIKDIPKEERPRERLIRNGVQSLSNEELLSIIIKTGTKEKSVKELALEVLKKIESIEKLQEINIETLTSIKGIGGVKATEIIATIELGKRIFIENKNKNNKRLKNAKDIYEEVKYLFYGQKQEYFYCLYFNNKQELIEKKLLFLGTVNRSIIHPREIFKNAYLTSASSIVCIHNHPSGDPTPSKEDIKITKQLIDIGNINGIYISDHIIVGDNKYYSFYDNNLI